MTFFNKVELYQIIYNLVNNITGKTQIYLKNEKDHFLS